MIFMSFLQAYFRKVRKKKEPREEIQKWHSKVTKSFASCLFFIPSFLLPFFLSLPFLLDFLLLLVLLNASSSNLLMPKSWKKRRHPEGAWCFFDTTLFRLQQIWFDISNIIQFVGFRFKKSAKNMAVAAIFSCSKIQKSLIEHSQMSLAGFRNLKVSKWQLLYSHIFATPIFSQKDNVLRGKLLATTFHPKRLCPIEQVKKSAPSCG